MVQNVVEKQFLRQEGPTALKFEYHILGPNWDPRTETWPGRTPSAGRGGLDFHNPRLVTVKDVWSDVMTKNHNVNGNIL